ncbi:MAG: hypothetical protein ACPGO5_03400 [Patescibacteria group bacterium]
MSPLQQSLQIYRSTLQQYKKLASISDVLLWDREQALPEQALPRRSHEFGMLERMMHEVLTSSEYVSALHDLYDQRENLSEADRRGVELSMRSYHKQARLPAEFVQQYTEIKAKGFEQWTKAKQANDFRMYAPYFEEMIAMSREYAQIIDSRRPVYDVLLDVYEEGTTYADVEVLFSQLLPVAQNLVQNHSEVVADPLKGIKLDPHTKKAYLETLLAGMGFDFTRGVLGTAVHGRERKVSKHDTRLFVPLGNDDLFKVIQIAIHEMGHGLYDQYVLDEYSDTDLDRAVSVSIDESQARLFDSYIMLCDGFWEYALRELAEFEPRAKDIDAKQVAKYARSIQPSLNRVNSDQVGYIIHVAIRYQIERDLLDGALSMEDLPKRWDADMKKNFGTEPKTLSEGCLQDVHWPYGMLGYFPNYVLGTAQAAQMWKAYTLEYPEYDQAFAGGDFTSIRDWFSSHIWQHGKRYAPETLLRNATGDAMQPQYYIEYLKSIYSK